MTLALALVACSAPTPDASRVAGRALANFAVGAPSTEPDLPHLAAASLATEGRGPCPAGMAEIPGTDREATFCVDRWEASLIELTPSGERPFSPFSPITGRRVRAASVPNVFPQGYVSAVQAEQACAASGKRLCTMNEWRKACRGPDRRAFGYADRREAGRCNDKGRNPVIALFGRTRWNWNTMNRPELNQLSGTLAKTGEHAGCTNGYGVFDMVGNLHEWVADARGTFTGGYYQDVASVGHGAGCGYVTTAHEARYHDYSTGFRCCAAANGSRLRGP
jgi:sulfatase modifying factor 1